MLLLLLLLLLLFPPKQFAHDILEHLPPIFPTQTQRSLIDLSGLRLEGSTSVPVYLFKKKQSFSSAWQPGITLQGRVSGSKLVYKSSYLVKQYRIPL